MAGRQLQFVVKISKYCNLRCSYCYEYTELGRRQRMTVEQATALFEHVAPALEREDVGEIDFIWHGGEPLLVPLDTYEEIARRQRAVFGAGAPVRNTLQTNLTVLTPRHLRFLQERRFFTDIGVSFDVHGGQRVDLKGDERQGRILANMQALIDGRVPFAAIAVLCRATRPHVRAIYDFYDRAGIPFRLLPIDSESFGGQAATHALSVDETVAALLELADAFRTSPRATPAEPVDGYLDFALAHLGGRGFAPYDKAAQEGIFVVELDGSLWGVADAGRPDYCYGNIFEQTFAACWDSAARARACRDADVRIREHCAKCPYFGACPGFFAGDAEPVQRRALAEAGCPVRGVLDGLVERLRPVATGLAAEGPAVASG